MSAQKPRQSADYVCIAEDNAAARGICAAAEKRDREALDPRVQAQKDWESGTALKAWAAHYDAEHSDGDDNG